MDSSTKLINVIAKQNRYNGLGGQMDKNEFKDRLFDILNDTDDLSVKDIVTEDRNDVLNIYLEDGRGYMIHVTEL